MIAADPVEGGWYAAEDIDRMVREIDVALNGDGAAQQARLCDVFSQVLALAAQQAPISDDTQASGFGVDHDLEALREKVAVQVRAFNWKDRPRSSLVDDILSTLQSKG